MWAIATCGMYEPSISFFLFTNWSVNFCIIMLAFSITVTDSEMTRRILYVSSVTI